MDCRSFNRKLEDYLQGGLDFPGRFGMERHARQCYACGKTVTDAQKLSRVARSLGRVRAPADFESALMARIQKEGLAHRHPWFWRFPLFWTDGWQWRLAVPGALALVVVGVGLLVSLRWTGVDREDGIRVSRRDIDQPQAPQQLSTAGPAAVALPSTGLEGVPDLARPFRTGAAFSAQDSGLSIYAEPAAKANYVEYSIPGPDNRPIVMRLPKTIWMRYDQPSEEYYIRNVSH